MVDTAGSQRKLAALIGKSDANVINWLKGATPFESTLRQISKQTGVSLEWLRDGTGDPWEEMERLQENMIQWAPGTKPRSGRCKMDEPRQTSRINLSMNEPEPESGLSITAQLSEELLAATVGELMSKTTLSIDERMRLAAPYQQELQRRRQKK